MSVQAAMKTTTFPRMGSALNKSQIVFTTLLMISVKCVISPSTLKMENPVKNALMTLARHVMTLSARLASCKISKAKDVS